MFAYMVPLMSGSHRSFSTPFDSFWCCVGTGMESHAKHGDSIWWESGDSLIANLYVPSVAEWAARGVRVRMDTEYPYGERVTLTVEEADAAPFEIALRVPAWCEGAGVAVNGTPQAAAPSEGYFRLRRRWRAGDRIDLDLPLRLRSEATVDDSRVIALLHGPLVLAADLGPVEAHYDGPAPVLVGGDPLAGFVPVEPRLGRYRTGGIGPSEDLEFAPFFAQRHRRTAVYFRSFDEAGWAAEQAALAAAEAQRRALDSRTVDIVALGDEDSERAHGLEAENSYAVVYRGRPGRDARARGHFAFRVRARPIPHTLRATYWGEERDRLFDIIVEGRTIATQRLHGDRPGEFFDVEYAIPADVVRGKETVEIRFQPASGTTRCGPVFGVRLLEPETI
jgi:hypothetical protein